MMLQRFQAFSRECVSLVQIITGTLLVERSSIERGIFHKANFRFIKDILTNSMSAPNICPRPEDTDKILWEGPHPQPDQETLISDYSCQGTISIALLEALSEIRQEAVASSAVECVLNKTSEHDSSRGNQQSPSAISPGIKLTQQSVDRIMYSFGNAVAQSQKKQWELEASKQKEGDSTQNIDQQSEAPAVVLRGRIDHYNRHSSKWRFMVHDAELRPRRALDRDRRKRERPSLWQVCQGQQAPSIKFRRLEILVYNDVE